MSTVYALVAMTVLAGFVSLGVDVGRVQLVRTELQAAADAAARAAALKLATGGSPTTAAAAAVEAAGLNSVDGASQKLLADADVELGRWNAETQTFTLLTGSARSAADAVRVTARRLDARQTAVPLLFGGLIGKNRIDLQAPAVALFTSVGYGVIGLDYIYMTGNSSDSYWSPSGDYTAGSAQSRGSIASNGNITLSGSSSIHGDARPGVGKTVNGASSVYGDVRPLTTPLSFPNGDPGTARTTNDNWRVPSTFTSASSLSVGSNKSLTLPGGVYYYNNVSVGGSLTFTGPATLYVYGTFNMTGHAVTGGNLPKNLDIVMVPTPSGNPPGAVNIGSSAALYADIYAPQSAVHLDGTGDIYGSVLGKSVSMTGTSSIHYDSSLGGRPSIGLVK